MRLSDHRAWLYAMTPEASRWMDWLDAELGDVTMRKTWRERQRPTAAGTADGSRLLPLMSRFNGLQCRCRRPAIMLGLEQWNSTLSGITGTLVRGTERITSSALFNALEVGPDPSTRQKVGKRTETSSPVPPARFSLSCSRAVVPVRCQPGLHTLQQSDGGMASAITC
jgi:hypothetical protein